ncbi:MAG: DinB family protein [Blastocatellia bacterium]|nr:DinB family protein [Blastocatellia bacterium]
MSELEAIIDELKSIHDGDAWHGPSLGEILSDVTAEQAAAKPIATAHNIWELVSHIAVWENVFTRRLEGHPTQLSEEDDFPTVTDASEEAWRQTLAHLNDSHAKLLSAISNLADEDLNETAAGTDYSIRFMLRGAVRHSVYHAGQIALLRRAASLG